MQHLDEDFFFLACQLSSSTPEAAPPLGGKDLHFCVLLVSTPGGGGGMVPRALFPSYLNAKFHLN